MQQPDGLLVARHGQGGDGALGRELEEAQTHLLGQGADRRAAEGGDELGRQTGLGAGRLQLGGAQLGGDAGAVHALGGGGGGLGVLTHEH